MENKIIFIALMAMLCSLGGCDKGQLLDSTGRITTETRQTGIITQVAVYDNVNLIFTNRLDSGTIMVSAGENIISKISTEFDNNTLVIKNKNKFNWTRDLNPDIRVYLPCNGIEYIYHRTVGTTSCETALTGNYLYIEASYGNGIIDLELLYDQITLHNTSGGITDVILKGQCNNLDIYHTNNAPFDCKKLQAKTAKVTETGIQNCFVAASERLEPTITNYGNIYYLGNPEIVNYTNTGKGELVRITE